MHDHLFDSFACWFQVSARVKVGRVFSKSFSDGTCHRKTNVCVDINFAYSHSRSFSQHIFRNTLGTEYFSAIGIALFNKFRNNGGSTMKNDRIIRQKFSNLFQAVIIQIGVAFVFIGAMACADGDSKGIAASQFNKFCCLIRISEDCIFCIYTDQVFYSCLLYTSPSPRDRG